MEDVFQNARVHRPYNTVFIRNGIEVDANPIPRALEGFLCVDRGRASAAKCLEATRENQSGLFGYGFEEEFGLSC